MKKFDKEELIKIFEDQIDGIQKLKHIIIPDLNNRKQYSGYRIKINYGVSGADVLHPNFEIELYVSRIYDKRTYSIRAILFDPVEISNEEGERLIEQLNLAVEKLKEKNLIKN